MAIEFRYPTGARPLLIEETARRRRIETRFVSLLENAGFAEVVLPIIDFAEPYAEVVDRKAARGSYRFCDREGELVAIRSDFTPMVARALASTVSADDLPLRVFYRGDVIRCEATRLGANRELFQIGAEIIGDRSVTADIDALRLVAEVVRAFGVEPLVVYNDLSIVDGFEDDVRAALRTKRTHAELPLLASQLIAGTATLGDVCGFDPAAAERLEQIADALDDSAFVLHLDDVDEPAGYYTGLRFRVYDAKTKTQIAAGGRYDGLYAQFGAPAAAIGFTFTIDDLSPS
ncbi:MAG TPA: ATP phosphoribosyltransferase regulatory subunit [Thermoanaerobaculia bacterium]|jgi:ATP phosphoribosyltransferase regulatory subunit